MSNDLSYTWKKKTKHKGFRVERGKKKGFWIDVLIGLYKTFIWVMKNIKGEKKKKKESKSKMYIKIYHRL